MSTSGEDSGSSDDGQSSDYYEGGRTQSLASSQTARYGNHPPGSQYRGQPPPPPLSAGGQSRSSFSTPGPGQFPQGRAPPLPSQQFYTSGHPSSSSYSIQRFASPNTGMPPGAAQHHLPPLGYRPPSQPQQQQQQISPNPLQQPTFPSSQHHHPMASSSMSSSLALERALDSIQTSLAALHERINALESRTAAARNNAFTYSSSSPTSALAELLRRLLVFLHLREPEEEEEHRLGGRCRRPSSALSLVLALVAGLLRWSRSLVADGAVVILIVSAFVALRRSRGDLRSVWATWSRILVLFWSGNNADPLPRMLN
jgi:hypothetical protein